MGGHAGGRIAIGLMLGLVFGLLAGPAQAGQPPAGDRERPAAASEQAKPPKPAKPVVKKVKPSSGPTTGGTVVKIKGKQFTKVKKVLFGTARGTSIRVKSKRKLTVVAPPHVAGTVAVRVVTKGGKSKKARKARFTYVAGTPALAAPVVTGLTPASGPTAGGTTVTISGKGLTGATAVSFGGATATFTVLSHSAVRVTSPAHAEGTVPVTVRTPAGTSAPVTFTYEASSSSPPAVMLVAPLTGPVAGGTVVTIAGTGFSGATAVSFGGTPATSFTVDSDTQITATTPAHAEGLVDVSVTTPAGTSTVPGLFTFLPLPSPPVVLLATPAIGPTAGGTSVTITGTGLSGATAVSFGGTPATSFTVDSDTQITATTPAHAEGLVAVSVTTPVDTSTVPGLFTYLPLPAPPPVVVLVTPAIGSPAGGNSVTITGTGFTGATAVSFGGTAATSFTVDSDLQITATTPAHALGLVDVSVTTPVDTSIGIGLFLYLL